jgi:hypothetical protein
MATSRRFGGTPSTDRPPMRISPPSWVSRPAIMRNMVDFPQPDGPTRVRNSPPTMASETPRRIAVPAKLFTIPASSTAAMK